MSITVKELIKINPIHRRLLTPDKYNMFLFPSNVLAFNEFRSRDLLPTQDFYIDYNNFKYTGNCKLTNTKEFVLIFNDN